MTHHILLISKFLADNDVTHEKFFIQKNFDSEFWPQVAAFFKPRYQFNFKTTLLDSDKFPCG